MGKRFLLLLTFFAIIGTTTGCFFLPSEAMLPAPPVFTLPEPVTWNSVEARRGDVVHFSTMITFNQPVRLEVVRFEIPDLLITGLYVGLGDEVAAGDVIASLDRSDILEYHERALQNEARLSMRLQQQIQLHADTLARAEATETPVDDRRYLHQINDLRADLDLVRQEIVYLAAEYETRLLRASIDGTITRVMVLTEGMHSDIRSNVATISDYTTAVFEVRGANSELLDLGDRFEMEIGDDIFWAEVINPDDIDIFRPNPEAQVAFLVLDEDVTFPPNVRGRIRHVFADVQDVLYVYSGALREVEDRVFVFVLEDGVRQIRDVQIGLRGTHTVEILSGLSEGEVVVI